LSNYNNNKKKNNNNNKLIEEDPVPEWLTAGVTFLIPKNENTENPKN
jgi:hypothetical protein